MQQNEITLHLQPNYRTEQISVCVCVMEEVKGSMHAFHFIQSWE